jgi:predicted lipid-binding transport protein (Tim44 family)
MEMPRSLAFVSLGLICLLATGCQTARTPGQPPAGAGIQATADASIQAKGATAGSPAAAESPATANTPAQDNGTSARSQVVAERQAQPPGQPASRNTAATPLAGVRRSASAQQNGVARGTLEHLENLLSVIVGREIDTAEVIDSAIAAGIVVLGIGTFATVNGIRHRRLPLSSSHTRR